MRGGLFAIPFNLTTYGSLCAFITVRIEYGGRRVAVIIMGVELLVCEIG